MSKVSKKYCGVFFFFLKKEKSKRTLHVQLNAGHTRAGVEQREAGPVSQSINLHCEERDRRFLAVRMMSMSSASTTLTLYSPSET